MGIYLIRHTTPLVEKGTCYGQLDLDVTEAFHEEAALIKATLPPGIGKVFTSPLQRCRKLAEHLFPAHELNHEPALMEINCGIWEGLHWDNIPPEEVRPWMDDFVNIKIPGGENYVEVYERTVSRFNEIIAQHPSCAIITHGGVIRSILSHITDTALKDSFSKFQLNYGCVVKVQHTEDGLEHEVIQNIFRTKEQHKPSSL